MTTTLCIKHNNCSVREICPLCRREFKADVGFVLWVDGTGDLVCDECAGKEDPHLLAACRQLSEKDPQLVVAERQLLEAAYRLSEELPASGLGALFSAIGALAVDLGPIAGHEHRQMMAERMMRERPIPDGAAAAMNELDEMYGGAIPF
jgi:hypothetical protein